MSKQCSWCGRLFMAPVDLARRRDGLLVFRYACGHEEVERYPGEWPVVTEGQAEAVRDGAC